MNDWWNDPPEEPEPPQCEHEGCDGFLCIPIGWVNITKPWEALDEVVLCDECGKVEFLPPEPDYMPEEFQLSDDELEEQTLAIAEANKQCPHGNAWWQCDACDHAGDLAYDAAREQRIFGRR